MFLQTVRHSGKSARTDLPDAAEGLNTELSKMESKRNQRPFPLRSGDGQEKRTWAFPRLSPHLENAVTPRGSARRPGAAWITETCVCLVECD